jgi:hypothetical protein
MYAIIIIKGLIVIEFSEETSELTEVKLSLCCHRFESVDVAEPYELVEVVAEAG